MSGKGRGKRSVPRTTETNGNHTNGTDSAKRIKTTANGNGHCKRTSFLTISEELGDEKLMAEIGKAWRDGEEDVSAVSAAVSVVKSPFTCVLAKNFAVGPLEELISDLQDIDFAERNNDLFKFKQSKDLKSEDSRQVGEE